LHDFDISGFSIAGTLCTSSSRYRYRNDVPIIDIGLRLADVKAMALMSEPFSTDKDWNKVSRTLKRHGVTPEEITFLERKRVELNAMAGGEFIHFIEKKFEEHGIELEAELARRPELPWDAAVSTVVRNLDVKE
jgi:hypothetical protein